MKFFRKKKRSKNSYNTFSTGFHGDEYLIKVIDFLVENDGVTHFIETGTNVGSTLRYVAAKYEKLMCLSCEPDKEAFRIAKSNTERLKNVKIFNQPSQEFIKTLEKDHKEIFAAKPLFWLDAHGYGFDWPLKDEIEFVSKNFNECRVLIDDFKVPGMEMFGYDIYEGQICSFDHIKGFFLHHNYQLYYPTYTEKTSMHHPLQGWGLFVFGESVKFPEGVTSFIKEVKE